MIEFNPPETKFFWITLGRELFLVLIVLEKNLDVFSAEQVFHFVNEDHEGLIADSWEVFDGLLVENLESFDEAETDLLVELGLTEGYVFEDLLDVHILVEF